MSSQNLACKFLGQMNTEKNTLTSEAKLIISKSHSLQVLAYKIFKISTQEFQSNMQFFQEKNQASKVKFDLRSQIENVKFPKLASCTMQISKRYFSAESFGQICNFLENKTLTTEVKFNLKFSQLASYTTCKNRDFSVEFFSLIHNLLPNDLLPSRHNFLC